MTAAPAGSRPPGAPGMGAGPGRGCGVGGAHVPGGPGHVVPPRCRDFLAGRDAGRFDSWVQPHAGHLQAGTVGLHRPPRPVRPRLLPLDDLPAIVGYAGLGAAGLANVAARRGADRGIAFAAYLVVLFLGVSAFLSSIAFGWIGLGLLLLVADRLDLRGPRPGQGPGDAGLPGDGDLEQRGRGRPGRPPDGGADRPSAPLVVDLPPAGCATPPGTPRRAAAPTRRGVWAGGTSQTPPATPCGWWQCRGRLFGLEGGGVIAGAVAVAALAAGFGWLAWKRRLRRWDLIFGGVLAAYLLMVTLVRGAAGRIPLEITRYSWPIILLAVPLSCPTSASPGGGRPRPGRRCCSWWARLVLVNAWQRVVDTNAIEREAFGGRVAIETVGRLLSAGREPAITELHQERTGHRHGWGAHRGRLARVPGRRMGWPAPPGPWVGRRRRASRCGCSPVGGGQLRRRRRRRSRSRVRSRTAASRCGREGAGASKWPPPGSSPWKRPGGTAHDGGTGVARRLR